MTGSMNDVAAVLEFAERTSPDLWALSGTFVWCIRQADIRIYRHDLAFAGETMTFATDHGRIMIARDRSDCGAPTVAIRVSAALEGSREVARQICYQLSRRVLARHPAESVFWQPTLQHLAPTNFKWAGLRDMPSHVNDTLRRAILVNCRSASA